VNQIPDGPTKLILWDTNHKTRKLEEQQRLLTDASNIISSCFEHESVDYIKLEEEDITALISYISLKKRLSNQTIWSKLEGSLRYVFKNAVLKGYMQRGKDDRWI
jgi:hypothetical protein